MTKNDNAANRRSPPITLEGLFVIAFGMAIYVVLSSSSSPLAFRATFLLLILLEIVRIMLAWKSSSRLDIGFEVAFFVVFLSVLLGAHATSLVRYPVLMFTTILYRPGYMQHGNRRLAFFLGVAIAAMVLPVTLGIVTDPSLVQMSEIIYALLVLCLWLFCSRLGAAAVEQLRP